MIYFSSIRLAMAKNNCADTLQQIAGLLGDKASQFSEAVNSSDGEKLDAMIDDAIQAYTGEQNVIFGLQQFCNKFGLSLEHPAASEWEYLRLISDNRDKISQILTENGH